MDCVGGGYVSKNGPENGKESGTVDGDITLNLLNGKFNGLNGGSSNSYSGKQGEKYAKVTSGTPYFGLVTGDVNITFGSSEYGKDSSMVQMTTSNALYAGSNYSVILGDVNVVFNNGTDLSHDDGFISFHGTGINDRVMGQVNLTQNGGEIDALMGMGPVNYNNAVD